MSDPVSMTNSCRDNQTGPKNHEVIITLEETPFEKVADFVIKNTKREQQDDGFYMMNMETALFLYKQWQEFLPRIPPFYAVKCNPDPVLVRQLHMLGTGFDCASISELELALSVGCQPDDIIYAHPCKKSSHLSFAEKCGVSKMTFDSKEELMKIKQLHPNAKLLIRFATVIKASLFDCNNFKYGADVEDCEGILATAKDMDLDVIGVSFHVGTGCFKETCYASAIECARSIFDQAKKLGFSFSVLDIGGGFPGFRRDFEESLFVKICNVINNSLHEYFPESMGISIIAEPGTYFADSPFKLVTNIIGVKEISRKMVERVSAPPLKLKENDEKGYMYYIDDGLYGSFGDVPDAVYKMSSVYKNSQTTYPSCICGHFCAGRDIVQQDCQLPKLSIGDWLYYDCFGAYTKTMLNNFNGFGLAKRTYYYITLPTWKKMNWTDEDFDAASVTFLGDDQPPSSNMKSG